MAKTVWQQSFEQTIGELIGGIEGVRGDIKRLNGDLKQHIRDHRSGWLWLIPTIISLSTLVVLIVGISTGFYGN